MKLIPGIAMLIALASAGVARAEIFELPEDEAVASVALPDSWQAAANPRDNSVSGVSPDGALAVRIVLADSGRANEVQAALVAGDPARGLVPDPAGARHEGLRISGRHGENFVYAIAGPTPARLRLIRIEWVPGKVLFVSLLGPVSAFDANAKAIAGILDQVKALDN